MTLEELTGKINGTIVVDKPGCNVSAAYTSDLLSDVMGHCGDESVLITIQNHLNTIAVCTLIGCTVLVICHSRPIPPDMAEGAAREGVAIVVTPLSQYAAALALKELPPSAH